VRILLIGSGGREHALAWKIAQSKKCEKLYAAPGSDGMSKAAERVNIKADDIHGLVKFAKEKKIGLTVVGPEMPLVAGIVDAFQKEGLRIFGPTKELALLEGSKVFSKEFMRRTGVPTADFTVFEKYDEAARHIESRKLPFVIKADGLAAGKGVVVCRMIDDARSALKAIMADRIFGDAGSRVIIEDCLAGEEASIIVIADGTSVVPLASSQDHKRVFDGDKGPNTGGMGAYSPVPFLREAELVRVGNQILEPWLRGCRVEGIDFRGILYPGIMLTRQGPKVLEFNARLGDPETQVYLTRLENDLVDVLAASVDGTLDRIELRWRPEPAVCVVMASGGYPGAYAKGKPIAGVAEANQLPDTKVFHAGTTRNAGQIVTNGGRVLGVTAWGADLAAAQSAAYRAVAKIQFDGAFFRRDIAAKALR
jgi:phosphoribosylamine--glycine ligase